MCYQPAFVRRCWDLHRATLKAQVCRYTEARRAPLAFEGTQRFLGLIPYPNTIALNYSNIDAWHQTLVSNSNFGLSYRQQSEKSACLQLTRGAMGIVSAPFLLFPGIAVEPLATRDAVNTSL